MHLAEVAPAAPFLIDALPSLLLLAALLFVVGCIYVLRQFVKALFGGIESLVGNVPFVGGAVSSATHSAEQAISNALGTAEGYFDKHIAAQFHRLARLADHFWHELVMLATATVAIAKMLSGYAALTDILRLERQLRRMVHAAEAQASTAIRHALSHAEAFTRTIAHGVYPRLRALEHEVSRTIPREIKATRELAKEAERDAARAWKLVRTKPWEIGATAFAGAVAIALDALGATGIRCAGFRNLFNKRGCGLWSDLDELLGLALLTVGAVSFEELVRAAQGLTEEGVQDFKDVFGL